MKNLDKPESRLANIGLWIGLQLFRITGNMPHGGGFGGVNYIELPPA